MAANAIARPQSISLGRNAVELIPGLLLLAAVGYAGKFIEQSIATYTKAHHTTFPNIEYVLWAIVIGLLIANTTGVPRIFAAGVATYEFWLKAGIVLLGSRFLLGDILHLGGISLLLVGLALSLSLTFMHLLGNAFSLKPKLTSLLAVGSSICGVSAIIAAKPSIDADDEDASYAIAAILALAQHNKPDQRVARGLGQYGDLAGGIGIESTRRGRFGRIVHRKPRPESISLVAQMERVANQWKGEERDGAYALYWSSRGQAQVIENKASFLWKKFPKFVLGFLLISLLATLGFFTKPQMTSLANLSRWAFLLTFAGVGLRTSLRDLGRQGWKPFAVGAIGEVFIALVTLGLVYSADLYFHL